LTNENNLIYEFSQKINSEFSLNNYFESRYIIDKQFSENFKLFEMPYYNNILFFLSDNSNKLNENYDKENLKVFHLDKKRNSWRENFNNKEYQSLSQSQSQSQYDDSNFINIDNKINNNYINNINININNSNNRDTITDTINKYNNYSDDNFNSIKINYNKEYNNNSSQKIQKKSISNIERNKNPNTYNNSINENESRF
jgi:hypothetical protein